MLLLCAYTYPGVIVTGLFAIPMYLFWPCNKSLRGPLGANPYIDRPWIGSGKSFERMSLVTY